MSLRRDLLDEQLRRGAVEAGATVLMGHRATTPIVERGFVRGASLTTDPELDPAAPRADEIRATVRRGGRRGQQQLRPRPRHDPATQLAVRHRDPHLLREFPSLGVVDRVRPRHPRCRRQSHRRIRVGDPDRRRHRQRRRRRAVDLPRHAGRERAQAARLVRPPDRGTLGLRPGCASSRRRRGSGSRWPVRSARRWGPPSSSSATPPAPPARSTATASMRR